jgi:hypothetical protein
MTEVSDMASEMSLGLVMKWITSDCAVKTTSQHEVTCIYCDGIDMTLQLSDDDVFFLIFLNFYTWQSLEMELNLIAVTIIFKRSDRSHCLANKFYPICNP